MRAAIALAVFLASGAAHADNDVCRPGAVHRGKPINLDVKDADIHDVMRLLADVGDVNIVVADTVQGKVTLHLKRVAWDQAACTIAALHKLRVTLRDGIFLVMPRSGSQ